jgi:Sulfotransferase family
MPTNHLNPGLIYRMFPRAKVIHVVRQPMNRDAIGNWRLYEKHVVALVEALEKYS